MELEKERNREVEEKRRKKEMEDAASKKKRDEALQVCNFLNARLPILIFTEHIFFGIIKTSKVFIFYCMPLVLCMQLVSSIYTIILPVENYAH